MPNPDLIVVLADLHIGSTVGLLPPGFVTDEGNEVKQNAMQKWLWDCWLAMDKEITEIARGDQFALVSNGDALEGIHHRTTQVISADVGDQVKAAIQILEPLAEKAHSTYMVMGTEAHTGVREISIARAIGAQEDPNTGVPGFNRLFIDKGGIRTVFRHHVSTAVRPWLEAGALSIHLAEEQLEATRNDEPVPRLICGAHRHRHGLYSNGREAIVISPPWQGLTRFGHKVVSAARTKPGFYVIDWRGVKHGDLPHIHERLYDAPKPIAIQL